MKLPAFAQFNFKLPKFLKLDLTSKTTFIVIFAVLLLALGLMWFYGADLQILGVKPLAQFWRRVLITCLVLLVMLGWGAFLVIKLIKEAATKEDKEEEEEQEDADAPIKEQQDYLNNWLLKLQKRSNKRKDFEYQLPWYLLIGDTNSGKSSLIGQTLKTSKLHSVGSEQHVTCLLHEQAVIIEANGTLFNSADDAAANLWQNLLDWLAEKRRIQPLNGIVLTLDLLQLCHSSKEEKETYIAKVQGKLQDIAENLNSKIPVYIVFTKIDLLYGFAAMYQNLTPKERAQIMGITFALNDHNWQASFTTFWQQLLSQLNNSLATMMLENVKVRSQLFTFVRQINGMQNHIKQFIDDIFYSLPAPHFLLRGIYLTSSMQQGQMDDLFVKAAAKQYNLPEQVYPSWQKGHSHPYFTYDLLHTVLFKESDLAGISLNYQKQNKRRLYYAFAASVLTVCPAVLSLHYYYEKNKNAGHRVLAEVKEYKNYLATDSTITEVDYLGNLQLPLLNPIGNAVLAYGDYHKHHQHLAHMGLYQGYKVIPYIENVYLQLLLQKFMPAILSGLQLELEQYAEDSESKLNVLRIMRMLEDESGRNKNMVVEYMLNKWSLAFKGHNELQNQLHQHLSYALDHVEWKKARLANDKLAIQSYLPFAPSIKKAQLDLSYRSIYQRIYQNIRSQSQSHLPLDLNLKNQIGVGFDAVFSAIDDKLLNMPQLLTRTGLTSYFVVQDKKLIELTALDNWVLEITSDINYSESDLKTIEHKITELYLNDYINAWHSAYSNLRIKKFARIDDAIAALEQIMSNEQVFKKALFLLQENSSAQENNLLAKFMPSKEQKSEQAEKTNTSKLDAAKQLAGSSDLLNPRAGQLLGILNNEFKKETSVIIENEEQNSDLQNVHIKLNDLHRYLMAINNSPSAGKAALQAVADHLKESSTDPIFEAQQLAKSMPPLLKRWVFELTDEIWSTVMITALTSLEDEWRTKIIKPYQQYFVGRYPFQTDGKLDVPLSEFERFFNYDGTLDTFYQQNLKMFIEHNLSASNDGTQIISSEVLKQLELAAKIRRTFFDKHQGLGVSFSLQPLVMSGSCRSSILNLDGQLVEYKHAKNNSVRLIWPNSMRDNIQSRLNLNCPNNRNKALIQNGAWGLIRLINSGKLTNVNNDSFDVRFDINNHHITYRIYIDEADNPFAGGLFKQFSLPDSLY